MPADGLARRPLGGSGIEVSELSLGSWRTFERLPAETGIAIMRAARDEGINFFDDARYDDETGQAPIPTGYSEVRFGELFRGAGVPRDEAVVANKLWWEFWPQQSAAAELDASLRRMGFGHVDLIYANPPPAGLAVTDLVRAVGGLVTAGKARAWGIVNWPAGLAGEAVRAAAGLGFAPPCAAQLPYSLVHRSWVEDPAMTEALSAAGAGVIASFCLAGGVLTGVPPRPADGARRRGPGRAAVRRRGRGGRRPGRPGRPAADHRGRAGAGVPAAEPVGHERAVRGHQPRAAAGQLRGGGSRPPPGRGGSRPAAADRAARGLIRAHPGG